MKLVTIDDGGRGRPGAVLASGAVVDLAALPGAADAVPNSVRDILASGQDGLARVADLIAAAERDGGATIRGRQLADTALLSPIPEPSLILAVGLNYHSHLAEMSNTPQPKNPTAFLKAPSSVTGSGTILQLPPAAPDMVDYEGELACVFGSTCHDVSVDAALDHIAGYTIANDFSARNWVQAVFGATQPWEARQTWEVNIMGKQFPGFTALGPMLVTADEIADIEAAVLTTTINGEELQRAPIGDMIFGIAELIAYFSRWYTFRPGDVLLTGTPAGVGSGRNPQRFVKPDDKISVSITGLGTLLTTAA